MKAQYIYYQTSGCLWDLRIDKDDRKLSHTGELSTTPAPPPQSFLGHTHRHCLMLSHVLS